jgi:hypothetical protein
MVVVRRRVKVELTETAEVKAIKRGTAAMPAAGVVFSVMAMAWILATTEELPEFVVQLELVVHSLTADWGVLRCCATTLSPVREVTELQVGVSVIMAAVGAAVTPVAAAGNMLTYLENGVVQVVVHTQRVH